MLSSPDANGSKGERFGPGDNPSVAKPSTIWYPRARVNPESRHPRGATREHRATAERSRAEPAF